MLENDLDSIKKRLEELRKWGQAGGGGWLSLLGISDRVYTIDAFLEKVTAENPGLADYKVLSVQKEYFGNTDIFIDNGSGFSVDDNISV